MTVVNEINLDLHNFSQSYVLHFIGKLIRRNLKMWVITRYEGSNISMYEFETEVEAKEALKNMSGCTILSEVIYYNDPCFQQNAA
jgi:hypothetical protein